MVISQIFTPLRPVVSEITSFDLFNSSCTLHPSYPKAAYLLPPPSATVSAVNATPAFHSLAPLNVSLPPGHAAAT